MPLIYLYAEHLLNVRLVTVFAALPTPANKDTSVTLSSGGRTLRLEHNDELMAIELPATVHDDVHLSPTIGCTDMSFRLQVGSRDGAEIPPRNDGLQWSAPDLMVGAQMACLNCAQPLVGSGLEWKDLPSGGWADMMDFWHCHKPTVREGEDALTGRDKGYAADNAIAPAAGVGLVDVSYFLLHPSDSTGIRKREIGSHGLQCASCNYDVGFETMENGHFQVFKWSVALQVLGQPSRKTFSLQKIISAQLLAVIEQQAVHKFVIHSGDLENTKEALFLWVFTADLTLSSSTSDRRRAMKLFYKSIVDPAEKLNANNMRIEELELPQAALDMLHADLMASTSILPSSARHHQDWTIGLLER
ncbi:MAG: hypothetical protein Q9163_004886 [Psora crenata]